MVWSIAELYHTIVVSFWAREWNTNSKSRIEAYSIVNLNEQSRTNESYYSRVEPMAYYSLPSESSFVQARKAPSARPLRECHRMALMIPRSKCNCRIQCHSECMVRSNKMPPSKTFSFLLDGSMNRLTATTSKSPVCATICLNLWSQPCWRAARWKGTNCDKYFCFHNKYFMH